MNFISIARTPILSVTPNLYLLAATLWRGSMAGESIDTMNLFYGISGPYPESCGKPRSESSTYELKQMNNEADLLTAFTKWLNQNSDNAVIVATEDDCELLRKMAKMGTSWDFHLDRIVNLDAIWPLRDLEIYARRHGITWRTGTNKAIQTASLRALCYRHLLFALDLNNRPASEIADIDRKIVALHP